MIPWVILKIGFSHKLESLILIEKNQFLIGHVHENPPTLMGAFTLDVKSMLNKKSRWHPRWHPMLKWAISLMLSEC
jgi:hypothetical protein